MNTLIIFQPELLSDALRGQAVIMTGPGEETGSEPEIAVLRLGASKVIAVIDGAGSQQIVDELTAKFSLGRTARGCLERLLVWVV